MGDVMVKTKPLEVELYVCEKCHLVGKIPQGRGSSAFRGFCTGEAGNDHKRVAMKLRRFREVVE